jgi:hypothetical protein
MDLEGLLAADEAGWKELVELFAQIPADRFDEPTVTPEGWSPKDVMFHVAAWMADAGHQLERMRAGTFNASEETPTSIQERNGQLFEASKAMEPSDVRIEFFSAHQRMCEELGEMPELTPEAVEWFEESGPLHYAQHIKDLRGWLGDAAS